MGPAQYLRPMLGALVDNNLDPLIAGGHGLTTAFASSLGASVDIPFTKGSWFALEPTALLYWSNYEYMDGRAIYADESFTTAFGLGLLFDTPIVVSFPLGKTLSLGLGIGPCVDLRYAFQINAPYLSSNYPYINQYFWENGHFFQPEGMIRLEYKLTDNFGFGFTGRFLWPAYNYWSSGSYSFMDRSMIAVNLSIRYTLPEPKPKKPPEAPAAPTAGEATDPGSQITQSGSTSP